MDSKSRAEQRSAAVIAQLNAELGASSFTKKSLAKEIGVDYSALRNYLDGVRPLSISVLMRALDALGTDPAVFTARAMERAGK